MGPGSGFSGLSRSWLATGLKGTVLVTKLILTNGDSAVGLLEEAGAGDNSEIVPWSDMLHSGPVPVTNDEYALTEIRAAHLADGIIHTVENVLSDLKTRNSFLDLHQSYESIELWFEHDLYDQLQLVQILDMLHNRGRQENIVLVQAPDYLGMQTAETILRFEELAILVSPEMSERAVSIWNAFREPTPVLLAEQSKNKTIGFPFLRQALVRLLQELPGPDGLSRTERQILYSLNRGVNKPGLLFARNMNMEEAAFLGDWEFFSILSNLVTCETPLIDGLPEHFEPVLLQDDNRRKSFIGSQLELTSAGQSVLEGDKDNLDLNEINRWLGGCHLKNGSVWRWNDEGQTLSGPGQES